MIVLVGFMGAGKTTVGRRLALVAGLPFVDIDEEIERASLKEISEIFDKEGEPAFREREREAITRSLAGESAVVAVGGGALGDPRTRTELGWHDVVHLDVTFAEAMRRVGGGDARPMLQLADPKALYDERARQYRAIARITIDTDDKTPDEVASTVAEELGLQVETAFKRVVVRVPDRSYDVLVGNGILQSAIGEMPELPGAENAVVITQPNPSRYARPVADALNARGLTPRIIEVPDGETSKSLDTARALFESFAAIPVHRHDLVVSVGGGVMSDLSAFVASTYNRGMPVVHVATTLLAQVDAAVGGKTGINLDAGKNLVGTIHQPRLVICDVSTLRTLPDEEFVAGMAEVAKYGFIEDPSFLDLLITRTSDLSERDPEVLQEIVTRCVGIKASIVSVDERETGVREVLNYGHTFAHAIESTSGLAVRHGHAVALGMMAAAHLAHEVGRIDAEVVDRHREVLEALGLPVTASLDLDVLSEAWMRDKKYRGGVRFVLLAALGKAETGVTAPRSALSAALERLAG
jgi:shikimate kinase / 3-dehydroquinate synthase